MMKYMSIWAFALAFLGLISCSDDAGLEIPPPGDNPPNEFAEINDFIWSGLNLYYLWQGNVVDLSDDRFSTEADYQAYLQESPVPEELFESLIYDRQNTDFFSWIVDDYVALENQFQGISTSNGVDFGLSLYATGSNDVFGYVRLILPDSDASDKNIKRGDLFIAVDGNPLTVNNYRELLFSDNSTYSLTLATLEGNTIVPTGEVVELVKSEYTENPVFDVSIIEEGGKRIGYLHYTFFNGSFESELNAAFLTLKNEGITDLVLDLRYNPGGYGVTALAMAGMITGQFKGEVFGKDEYNDKIQPELEAVDPDYLIERFVDRTRFSNEAINSLNLTKLHVIVSDATASAGESVINGLSPYIDVTLIGELTYGKYTGSITLYDSADFGKNGANPDHTYAMQPIIVQSVNKNGESAKGGFEPDIFQSEDIANMGIIGDSNEPLLRTAINDIIGVAAKLDYDKIRTYDKVSDYRSQNLFSNELIVDKPEIRKALSKYRKSKN
jgi:carboxyl-terminal processing protease